MQAQRRAFPWPTVGHVGDGDRGACAHVKGQDRVWGGCDSAMKRL